jgi:hypothetical protein
MDMPIFTFTIQMGINFKCIGDSVPKTWACPPPPRDFKELHTKTMELYVINQALIISLESNTYQPEILEIHIEESNKKLSQLQPLMIEGLQKADLCYKINQDGSLTYWIKEDYAGSLE